MPRLNGTGPMGQGPMTGRGLGPCGGGMRTGWGGRGFGWRSFFRSPKNQQQSLDEEEKMLEEELEAVRAEKKSLKK
ncbi:MAG: DUF5320 domain-containing protein [Patescibacteria group bacterium]|nr:DUF5320 domain-containing protein [Patescibacteria group bacterium]